MLHSGNESATREEIESAAREANCEFVWGMPNGFDTESKSILCIQVDAFNTSFSWTFELEWWSATAVGDCTRFAEEACYSCT